MTPWEELLVLAEAELAMVRGGDALELPGAIAARGRLAATLGPAPASAGPVLERLAAVQEQIVVELTLARDGVARELGDAAPRARRRAGLPHRRRPRRRADRRPPTKASARRADDPASCHGSGDCA